MSATQTQRLALALISVLATHSIFAKESVKEAAKAASPTAACKLPSDGSKADAYWQAMTCFMSGKDFSAAALVGEALIKNEPNVLRAYILTSWFYWNQSQLEVGRKEADLSQKAENLLNTGIERFPESWQAYVERGDFYFLRLKSYDKAYADFIKARSLYDMKTGKSHEGGTPDATPGRKASIENRIARVSEKLERTGEAVEASCRALYFDPDNKSAIERLKRMQGSCLRKKVADPRGEKAGGEKKGEGKEKSGEEKTEKKGEE